jgi:hypothetical protein
MTWQRKLMSVVNAISGMVKSLIGTIVGNVTGIALTRKLKSANNRSLNSKKKKSTKYCGGLPKMYVLVKNHPDYSKLNGFVYRVTGENEDFYYLEFAETTISVEKKYCTKLGLEEKY